MEKEFVIRGRVRVVEILDRDAYRTKGDFVAAALSRCIDRMMRRGMIHPFDAAKLKKKHVSNVSNVMAVPQKPNDSFQKKLNKEKPLDKKK